MKRRFVILSGILAMVLIACGLVFGFRTYRDFNTDASSHQYVDETVPIIVSGWSKEEMLKRTSPQFMAVSSVADIQKLFSGCSQKLGPLKHYAGSRGQATVSFDSNKNKMIKAEYVANATFLRGEAAISIRLIRLAGHWQYEKFWVDSPQFTGGSDRRRQETAAIVATASARPSAG